MNHYDLFSRLLSLSFLFRVWKPPPKKKQNNNNQQQQNNNNNKKPKKQKIKTNKTKQPNKQQQQQQQQQQKHQKQFGSRAFSNSAPDFAMPSHRRWENIIFFSFSQEIRDSFVFKPVIATSSIYSSFSLCVCVCAVSYTHLTLPTRRTV